MKKICARAFSLVELMVTLIIVSCIMAALAPSITKKLKSQGITVGSGGGGGNVNVDFEQDCSQFGEDCVLCLESRCSLCSKECLTTEYTETSTCTCKSCTSLDSNCIECSSRQCKKCADGYYPNVTTCQICEEGNFCDGTTSVICPVGYYCENGNRIPCPLGTYNDTEGALDSTSCKACSDATVNCATCDAVGVCTGCNSGYTLDGATCKTNDFTYTYTGTHSKTATSEYTRITLTSGGTFTATSPATATVMALGGGGGGGGSAYDGEAGTYGCSGYNTQSEVVFSTNDSYSVTIGTGGSYGRGSCKYGVDYDGSAGTQTKFGSITASGGGGGYGGWNSGSCRGGSAVTFAGLTYASGRDKGVNSGTGGSGATGKYDNGETTCGYNGKAGASGIVVIMIPK